MADANPVEELDPTKTDDEAKVDVDVEPADGAQDGKSEDKPKPGTPDKVTQKIQQDLAAVTRQLAALTEKKEEQGQLSEADKARLEKVQARLAKIREYADDPIAEHVLDLTEKVVEQDGLKAELSAANKRLAQLENYVNWDRARSKYAGLDVDAIWEKASADAGETLDDTGAPPQAINRLASKLFEERCEAAKKRLKDGPDKGKANNSASSPSEYRVGSGQKTAPVLSDEEQVLAEARSLVVEI